VLATQPACQNSEPNHVHEHQAVRRVAMAALAVVVVPKALDRSLGRVGSFEPEAAWGPTLA
jgi:hypothetical protein